MGETGLQARPPEPERPRQARHPCSPGFIPLKSGLAGSSPAGQALLGVTLHTFGGLHHLGPKAPASRHIFQARLSRNGFGPSSASDCAPAGTLPASFPSNWPGCFSNTHPEHPRTFLAARKTQLAKIQVTCHSSRKGRLCTNQRPATDPTRTGDICGAIIILLYCLSIQPTLRQGLPYGPSRGIRAALPFPRPALGIPATITPHELRNPHRWRPPEQPQEP